MDSATQVLVVGAGPTGMTAALELAGQGIAVRLVERSAEPATTSRAVGVQARTLELFQQRGLADAMLAKGLQAQGASIYGGGKRLFEVNLDEIDSRYAFILLISQAETEGILREALARAGVTIEREVELAGLSQTDRGGSVTAFLKHKDGSLESVTLEYLIDAEGAHSVARTTLNLQFEGKTFPEGYLLGDLQVEGDLPSTNVHIFSSEHGFVAMFPLSATRFRLIASQPAGEVKGETGPSLGELQAVYDQRSHIPARFHDLTWSSWFRINSRMVEKLQVGRIFLGGDSAHIHSPAGGQGMNTGIQDMINLGWKIAMVLKGEAAPKLLDTYSEDRVPVIRKVLSRTEGLTKVVGAEDHLVRTVFNHVAPWVVGSRLVQHEAAAQMGQIALNYRGSPLAVTEHAGGEVHGGDRVPDMAVRAPEETTLYRLMQATRLSLLVLDGAEVGDVSRWSGVMDVYRVTAGAGAEARFKRAFGDGASLVLVRPDGYAGFVGSAGGLRMYLEEWFPGRG